MEFTKKGYSQLLYQLKKQSYHFTGFNEKEYPNKCVIMRHDIDFTLAQAEELAKIEENAEVSSTWMVLLNTDFYNAFSRKSRQHIRMLQKTGGKIGLHFDETLYARILEPLRENSLEKYKIELCNLIENEISMLSQIVQEPVETVAFHRPSKEAIALNLELPDIVNAYGRQFFEDFKYLSDSGMRWREDVDKLFKEAQYPRLQILTHPFWYSDEAVGKHDRLLHLCKQASLEQYKSLSENLSGLPDILSEKEVV